MTRKRIRRFIYTPASFARKTLVAAVVVFLGALAGLPAAHANCLDSAEEAAAAFFTGGASLAACMLAETTAAIGHLINIVRGLTDRVMQQATAVASAAFGVVQTGVDEARQVLDTALRDLRWAAQQGRAFAQNYRDAGGGISSTLPQSARPTFQLPPGAPAARPSPHADPARMQDALNRAAQRIGDLEAGIQREVAARAQGALQRAIDQARTAQATAPSIAETQLAQLLDLGRRLRDLADHPEQFLDASASINHQISVIENNIADTMNRINVRVTRDALATLHGVEADIHRAHDDAAFARGLADAMVRANREQNQAALNDLESLLASAGGVGASRTALPSPAGGIRFDLLSVKLDAGKAQAVAPMKQQTDELTAKWAAIKAMQAKKPAGVDANTRQRAEAELDRMFKGKSPAEVERAKAEFLARARQRYAKDPRLVATIEQGIHAEAAKRAAVPATLKSPAIRSP